ncbi:MAG: tRNA pseudouridine(55) synthase TruB [Lachnospiraceae bacterium]|nr:tRNA pseudouridine(55) synthase TruB [Lachnospiraceae bacterium]
MYNGMINVYKEAGYTSHDVVARLRGICKQKKIGHTGTLDPDAVGVLPVCLGSGTKLCDMLTDWDKEYIACLQLGVATDTQDMSGRVVYEAAPERLAVLSGEQVCGCIRSFVGSYDQIPPMYSALKVNGKKLYELAREGKEIERKPRTVRIEEIEILKLELPLVEFRVVCSKGTYIRTLCHDIGEKLGCGGAMRSLIRSRVGIFRQEDALTLGQIEQLEKNNGITDVIIPPDAIFCDLRAVMVTEAGVKPVQNGNSLRSTLLTAESGERKAAARAESSDGEQVRVYDLSGRFYGIYGYHAAERLYKPVRMFL